MTFLDFSHRNGVRIPFPKPISYTISCFDIFAEPSISDEKVLHAAAIAAELLDNDEDNLKKA